MAQARAAALAAAGGSDPAAGRRRGRLRRAVDDLTGLLAATRRIAEQTRQRLSGTTPDGATRRVSLHDGDARPIAKGRLGRPVEFGYKAQVLDNDHGVVGPPSHCCWCPPTCTVDRSSSSSSSVTARRPSRVGRFPCPWVGRRVAVAGQVDGDHVAVRGPGCRRSGPRVASRAAAHHGHATSRPKQARSTRIPGVAGYGDCSTRTTSSNEGQGFESLSSTSTRCRCSSCFCSSTGLTSPQG